MTLEADHLLSLRGLVKILWDYNRASQPPIKADLLLVMGTNDLGVARFSAVLEKKFDYTTIIVTGGVRHEVALHGQPFRGLEADILSIVMVERGVREAKIWRERKATNTGENIRFTKALLEAKKISITTGQLVHSPLMQVRALATAEKQWPEVTWNVSGDDLSYDDYIKGLDEEKFIHNVVGDTAKILLYPSKGFQTARPMSSLVRQALQALILKGFIDSLPEGFSETILAL